MKSNKRVWILVPAEAEAYNYGHATVGALVIDKVGGEGFWWYDIEVPRSTIERYPSWQIWCVPTDVLGFQVGRLQSGLYPVFVGPEFTIADEPDPT
jgi:hypothetical protein